MMKKYERLIATITSTELEKFKQQLCKLERPCPYAFMNVFMNVCVIGLEHPEWGSGYSDEKEGIHKKWDPIALMYELGYHLLKAGDTPIQQIVAISESEPQFALSYQTKEARELLKFALIRASFPQGGDQVSA
jgi:hypothetical protein